MQTQCCTYQFIRSSQFWGKSLGYLGSLGVKFQSQIMGQALKEISKPCCSFGVELAHASDIGRDMKGPSCTCNFRLTSSQNNNETEREEQNMNKKRVDMSWNVRHLLSKMLKQFLAANGCSAMQHIGCWFCQVAHGFGLAAPALCGWARMFLYLRTLLKPGVSFYEPTKWTNMNQRSKCWNNMNMLVSAIFNPQNI